MANYHTFNIVIHEIKIQNVFISVQRYISVVTPHEHVAETIITIKHAHTLYYTLANQT
jgi:hypothetical protein